MSKQTKVAEFNGINSYMETNMSNTYINRIPLTIEAWVKAFDRNDMFSNVPLGLHYPNNLISNDYPSYSGHGIGINKWTNLGGGCEITAEFQGLETSFDFINYPSYGNEWIYLSITYESGIIKIYTNGSLLTTYNFTQQTLDGTNTVRIGKHNDDNYYGSMKYFKGRVADVRIWNKALTQSEIQNKMYITLTGNENNLLAYYHYDESVGSFKNFVLNGINLNQYNINYVDETTTNTWKVGKIKYTTDNLGWENYNNIYYYNNSFN